MKVLLIGGTGLISTGIVKHLLARGAKVTMFNRAQRENTLPPGIEQITGDRNQYAEFESRFKDSRYDVVMDMICFNPEQAASDVRAFGGRCGHFIFCSTVCTYGVKIPTNVLVDETFPQEPISGYGKNKVLCEKTFLEAEAQRKFPLTIIRPSHTYGPGNPMICNLEFNSVAWDRIRRGLPVLCAGDGHGLWVSTHRDDCGKLFAYAAMNPKCYGQAYNATRDQNITWRDYFRDVSAALGRKANVLFMPAAWIVKHDARRFGLLHEISQFHGAYDSSKAKRDVPEFRCEIGLTDGAAATFRDLERRSAWKSSEGDEVYEKMIEAAKSIGVDAVEA
jgi:nucleoside-diphosphate-sugar epimerase